MKVNRLLLIAYTFFYLPICQAQNYALQFDGSNDRIIVSHNNIFKIEDGFTIEAWINANVWRAESWQGSLVTKDAQGPDSGFAFRTGKSGTLNFVMSVNQSWKEISSQPVMNRGQWYHVAVVVNNGSIRLFINGEVVATKNYSGTPTSNTRGLFIGESSGFPGRVFNGVIDEIRIWNVARTDQEIFDNQATAFTGNETGLVSYFPMNEGSGNTIGNLADGNLNGRASNFGANAWVDGFSIPDMDVAINRIVAPDVFSINQRPIRFQFNVQNNGNQSISNIPVSIMVNGEEVAVETIERTLQAGESFDYLSETILDLTLNRTNNVIITANHPDDANAFNNRIEVLYKKPDNSNRITLVDKKQHNFGSAGQTQFSETILPNDLEEYDKLLMHISVECPSTGCDPWDQPGKVIVIKENEEFEIARFITPFGIACGDWTVDITDFKSLLTGSVNIKSFIQVWGPSGWLLEINLEAIKSVDQEPVFQKITPLWGNDNLIYGDPNISSDLPTKEVTVNANTTASHLRMTISGHGQGNTDNAAEFSRRTHRVVTNGNHIANHVLWKTDCAQNVCRNQLGTWLFSRAGWCPGQQVNPFIVDLTSELQAGNVGTIDYELEAYTNLLHTGYNGGSHTEPHYRVWAYYIEQSSQRFEDYSNLSCEEVAVELDGNVFGMVSLKIKNTGNIAITNPTVTYFVNDISIAEETINQTIEAGAEITYQFMQNGGFTEGITNRLYALVQHEEDENVNDDAQRMIINADFTTDTKDIQTRLFKVFPNPSSGQIKISLKNQISIEQITVMDIAGKTISTIPVTSDEIDLNLISSGLYILRIHMKNQKVFSEKLIVLAN